VLETLNLRRIYTRILVERNTALTEVGRPTALSSASHFVRAVQSLSVVLEWQANRQTRGCVVSWLVMSHMHRVHEKKEAYENDKVRAELVPC
jgi:hypothetical protein